MKTFQFSLFTYLSILFSLPIAIGLVGGAASICNPMLEAIHGGALWNSDTLRILEDQFGFSPRLALGLRFAVSSMPGWLFLFFLNWVFGLLKFPSMMVLAWCIAIAIPLQQILASYYTNLWLFQGRGPNQSWHIVFFCVVAGGFASICWFLGHYRSSWVRTALVSYSERHPMISRGTLLLGAIFVLGLSGLGWSVLNQLRGGMNP